jgi:hypothetical protein
MIKLKDTFQKSFGVPIEQILRLKKNLIPIAGNVEDALLFGSKAAADNPYLLDPHLEEFIESTPEGYFLIGFWGYGVNSYAFYYSVVDCFKKVWFRLPYGGVYSNNDEKAKCIRNFLSNFFEFQHKLHNKIEKLIAMESMGAGYYKIIKSGGNIFEIRESFLWNPDFEAKFRNFLES